MYYVWVRSLCTEDVSSEWVSAGSFYTGVCVPAPAGSDAYFENVSTTGATVNLDNLASGLSENNYADNYTNSVVEAQAGDTLQFHFTTVGGQWGDAGVSVYIDVNKNMEFETSEIIFSSAVAYAETGGFLYEGDYSFSYAVPEDLVAGSYRIRMAIDDAEQEPFPCSISGSGEIEDYQLRIPECVPPTLSMTQDTTVCAGTVVTLATGVEGEIYTWSTNETTSTIQVNTSNTYSVEVSNGQCSSFGEVNVTVNPLPNVQISASEAIICEGDQSALTVTGAESYEWEDGSTESVRNVMSSTTTTYTVVGNASGCTASASFTVIVDENCLSVDEATKSTVVVFPNPSADFVQILSEQLNENFTAYSVLDLSGRIVSFGEIQSDELQIDVRSLENGVYLIYLQGATNKILKVEVKH